VPQTFRRQISEGEVQARMSPLGVIWERERRERSRRGRGAEPSSLIAGREKDRVVLSEKIQTRA
jgi:hypothetical protein